MTFKETIDKLFDRDNLAKVLENERAKGKTIVFTNGCFDLLHPGHVHLLKTSRSFGDLLVVAINTDSSIRGIKDTGRPIFSEVERAYMLSSLSCVAHILLFN